MSKKLRLSEKWFHRALWLVAFVFAWFLIGLGSAVVGDLPQVEQNLEVEQFIDPTQHADAQAKLSAAQQALKPLEALIETQAQAVSQLETRFAEAQTSFDNWVATRQATGEANQNKALTERTVALDQLKSQLSTARQKLEGVQSQSLQYEQAVTQAQTALDDLRRPAQEKLDAELRAQELRIFGYRLLLTLPLLLVAGWLFLRHRKGNYWPFVWGFIFFALFAFFVELVPYLPEYGGYVRYVVGIILTVLVGRYAMVQLQKYLEKQKALEALPESERRQSVDYDSAFARLAKGVCPGCERGIDLKDPSLDFCPHCGIGLHDHCSACGARKSAFAHYCHACGAAGGSQGA